jgi:SAM-dependent methyltransferase
VDLVIVVDTWHHIDERVRYLAKVARGLKADGRVAVVDFKKGSLPVGPPDEHKLAPEQIVESSSVPGGPSSAATRSCSRTSTCSSSRNRSASAAAPSRDPRARRASGSAPGAAA